MQYLVCLGCSYLVLLLDLFDAEEGFPTYRTVQSRLNNLCLQGESIRVVLYGQAKGVS